MEGSTSALAAETYMASSFIPWDNLIVDQDLAKELQCGICLQLLNKPRQCKNGHLFCEACIKQSLERSHECPHCRLSLKPEELARSLFVEKHIRNLKVWCKYHFVLPFNPPVAPSSSSQDQSSTKPSTSLSISSSASSSSSSSSSAALADAHDTNAGMAASAPGNGAVLSLGGGALSPSSGAAGSVGATAIATAAAKLATMAAVQAHTHIGYSATVDPEGCMQSFTLEHIAKHEATCEHAVVGCRFSAACGRVRRHQADSHEASCSFRPERCKHCQQDVPLANMDDHERVQCGMFPVQCPKGCGLGGSDSASTAAPVPGGGEAGGNGNVVMIRRGELENHLRTQCPEMEVDCLFANQGCKKKLVRKELKAHLAEETVDHLQLMKKGYDEQIAQMRLDFETQMKVKDERLKQVEKQMRENETKVEWKVKNFSSLRKKSYLQSDKFTIAGFTWFIGFYTDGDNPDSRGFISIYLFLDVAHLPKGKSITLEYYLKFVNHRDNHESVKKEFKTTFPIKGGQGWGDRKALKNAVLEQNGYLKDDVLHIEAEISVKRIAWSV